MNRVSLSAGAKLVAAIVVLILLFALAPFGTVPAGYRGVMTTFGSPSDQVLSEGEPGPRIIIPAVQEAVKAVTARFTAEELIAKRTDVRDQIVAQLRERLARHGIMVDEFSIVNFNFSRSFNDAIEAKTTAEQLKLKAERDLQRIEVEAKQRVAQARAEAESLAVQRQQVTPELIRLREMENQRAAIEKWDGKLPNVAGGAIPFINVTDAAK